MSKRTQVVNYLLEEVSAITGEPAAGLSEETRLIGQGSKLNSLRLVELLLALEEFSEDTLHVSFDWTSDSAMSEARSIYRTIGSLADYIASLDVS